MFVCLYVYVYLCMNVVMYICRYVLMCVCIYVILLFIIKHAPSSGIHTTYNNVTNYWYLVISRGYKYCLCSRRRTLHSLYNI